MIAQTIIPIPMHSGPTGPIPLYAAIPLAVLVWSLALLLVGMTVFLFRVAFEDRELLPGAMGWVVFVLAIFIGTVAFAMSADIIQAIHAGKSVVG